ncbi:MAG: UDP-N-acetylmuramoyl-tripeptide--D-alanyl-D-alanine ligase [Tannerellaceae bacterium]|jgi:UDP-N-acetylmuramoyl-tripeptide--D-alanyl-D-alanine ligase|nr:UDP-N-acetylmuramoyl-tripeptide--D-alanyl-D-alanine ligase [Tannerellaceae bacterium]
MDISELYNLFLHSTGVSIDSRNVSQGSLFFALKGATFNGNKFAAQALANGASYAVIDDQAFLLDNGRTVLMDNALVSLQSLASLHRQQLQTPLIGITGTNGKTTTKELIATVLSSKFTTLHTLGNYNNQIGLPLTLLRLTREHQVAVVEMGASRPGDIRELAAIAQPNFGIITNVGRAHLEGFGSFANLVQTKGELFDFIRNTQGIVFLKKENEIIRELAEGIKQVTYSVGSDAFVSGNIIDSDPTLRFCWKKNGERHTVETQLVGNYNIDNVMAAVAIGSYFGLSSDDINRAIAAYRPSNHRSQLVATPHNRLIVDAYNANPDSMRAAIQNFRQMKASPKAIILGDMKELGESAVVLHEEIATAASEAKFDKVFLCGELFRQTSFGFPTFPETTDLIAHLKAHPLQGYCILLKASHSMGFERIIEVL